MTDESPPKVRKPKKKKSFFVRGLVTLLPTVLTIFILVTVLQFVNAYLTSPINRAIYGLLDGNGIGWNVLSVMDIDPYDREFLDEAALPTELKEKLLRYGLSGSEFQSALTDHRDGRETFLRDFDKLAINRERLLDATKERVPPIIGIFFSFVIVLTLGYLASGFLGRRLIGSFDRTLTSIPIVRSVYPYTKQVVDFFLSENDELEFQTVVAAPYPSEGVWAIAFVTGNGLQDIDAALEGHFVSVFVPTSPMPMTGFTVFIEARRLIPLDLTVDEALRVTVSAGVLVPSRQKVADLEGSLKELGRRA